MVSCLLVVSLSTCGQSTCGQSIHLCSVYLLSVCLLVVSVSICGQCTCGQSVYLWSVYLTICLATMWPTITGARNVFVVHRTRCTTMARRCTMHDDGDDFSKARHLQARASASRGQRSTYIWQGECGKKYTRTVVSKHTFHHGCMNAIVGVVRRRRETWS